MTDHAHDWLSAASCHEGPRAGCTFAEMPREYRQEIAKFGAVALASSLFFLGVGFLAAPLPSRTIIAFAVLPEATVSTTVLLARVSHVGVPALPAPPTPGLRRARTVVLDADARRALASQSTAGPLATIEEDAAAPTSPRPDLKPRRRNVFSRLFRGLVRHSAAPTPVRIDAS